MNENLIDTIFDAAIQLESSEKRRAYLNLACEGNSDLREKIEDMLKANQRADAYFSGVSPSSSTNESVAPLDENLTEITLSEKPGTLIGRYKLLQKIGEGGMGLVYMAEQTDPVTRKVALKIIKLGMDTKQVVARFEAERQALALMDHPNIAKVLDGGSTDTGRPYFVMELVRGVPITEYCDKNKLDNDQRLHLFMQVCQAIQHAHQKGVIHRDIKPTNVMVTLHDGKAVPKVIDFGIAKATNQKLTEKTLFTNYAHMIGTPAYMSPEQAEMSGLDVDTRTDVYSLGVLLYELLTGKTPFGNKELLSQGYGEMQRIIAEQEPPKPSRLLITMEQRDRTTVAKNRSMEIGGLNKVFQGDLDWIVMKALEKDRSRRYDTANGLVADIRRYQGSEPIIARPPSAIYKFQKAWRRNKVMYAAGILVMGALLIGATVSTIGLKRSVVAQDIANRQRQLADQKAKEASNENARAEAYVEQLNQNLYISLVAQANREMESNRPSDAIQLLDECPESFRNWEWHYVRNRCYKGVPLTANFPEAVKHVMISPNGMDFATMGNGVVKLWRLSSDSNFVINEKFKPVSSRLGNKGIGRFSSNGSQFAIVDSNEVLRVFDVVNGKELQTFHGGEKPFLYFALHPSGEEITSVSEDGIFRIWDVRSGEEKHHFKSDRFIAYSLTYSPDGKWLAAGRGSFIRIFDTDSWGLQCRLDRTLTPVGKLLFSPDSHTLISKDDILIRGWGLPDGESNGVLEGHDAWIVSMTFSPDGTRLASSGVDRKVKIWDWKNKRELLTLDGHQNTVPTLEFVDKGRLISADRNGAVRIWDGAPRANLIQDEIKPLTLHSNRIWTLEFFNDGRLVSCAEDDKVFIWDLEKNVKPQEIQGIFDVACSMDQRFLLTAHWGKYTIFTEDGPKDEYGSLVRILDSQTLTERFKGISQTGEFFAADISPDSRFLAAGGYSVTDDGRVHVRIWDWQQQSEPWTLGYHDSGIMDVKFNSDGRYLATASDDGVVKLWDAKRLSEPQQERILWPSSAGRDLIKIAFSPDGKRLATGDGFNDVVVLDVENESDPLLRLKGHGEMVICVAYSPDGKYLASAGADHTVRVWDAKTGEFLHHFLGHTSIIHALAFSPDGRLLASGGQDQKIRLWRLDVLPH